MLRILIKKLQEDVFHKKYLNTKREKCGLEKIEPEPRTEAKRGSRIIALQQM